MYLFKHLFDFFKIDFELIKSVKRKNIIIFFASYIFLLLSCLYFKNNFNKYLILHYSKNVVFWLFFVVLFCDLQNKNFFQHLILNRGFSFVETEFFLFLIPFILFVIVLILLFNLSTSKSISAVELFGAISLIIDAVLFSVLKIKKYIIFTICWMLFTLSIPFLYIVLSVDFDLPRNIFINAIFNRIQVLTNFTIIVNIAQIIIEYLIIKKITIKKI